jgi:CRP-like cAMP-binding protein
MNRLARKLENFAPLSDDDKRFLEDVTRTSYEVPAGADLIKEGDAPDNVHLILDGFACRYKLTSEGNRQIMAYLISGDFCDLHVFILREMDHNIGTLSTCRLVKIPRNLILAMTTRPALARALWWATLVDEAVLREWLVNMGQREAPERIAHLLCELLLRLRAVGLAGSDAYELPITQEQLGDTMGLSGVHVNRSLQKLRSENLITLKNKYLVILDPDRLKEFGGFNPNYLHLPESQRKAN